MEPINVSTKSFTKELEWCARFIERKTTIPILTHVHLRKAGELLYLTATDLEHAATTSVPANGPEFELAVPVEKLLKYLKKVEDRALLLVPDIRYYPVKDGPHVEGCDGTGTEGCCEAPVISSARLTIQHGDESASVGIDGMSADSFPELPARPLSSIEIGGLETAIPRACIAISQDASRFTLNGALLDIKDSTAQFISTDGHRLSVADAKVFDCEWRIRNAAEPFRALIPKKALLEVGRLGDSAFLTQNEKHVFFTVGERTITATKLTGNFPDWERVMPNDLKYSVTVQNAALRKVLDRVSLFADERSHCVELSVNGTLTLNSRRSEQNATGQVPFTGPKFAYPYVSAFNATYLTEFLKTSGAAEFELRFGKSSRPAQLDVEGWHYVLMPMRDVGTANDPVVEGESEPVPAVIAWLEAQAIAQAAELGRHFCAQCQQARLETTEGDLCPACDKTWERVEPAVVEPEPAAVAIAESEPGLVRCVTCAKDLTPAAFEIRWDTHKPRRSCRACRKQPKSVIATLQAAVA